MKMYMVQGDTENCVVFFIATPAPAWESAPKFGIQHSAGAQRWEEVKSFHPPPNTDWVSKICNRNNLCCGVILKSAWGFQANTLPHRLQACLPQLPRPTVSLGSDVSLPLCHPFCCRAAQKTRSSCCNSSATRSEALFYIAFPRQRRTWKSYLSGFYHQHIWFSNELKANLYQAIRAAYFTLAPLPNSLQSFKN